MKTMKWMLMLSLLLLCLCSCVASSDGEFDPYPEGYNSFPMTMYYEGELYNLRHLIGSEIDIEGRELELLGKAVCAGINPHEFTENFQSNDSRVHGAEVYRQTNAQTTGLLILKIGETYYEIGSGSY